MQRDDPFIDEYTLAAFLAGNLPEKERAQVLAYLAASEDARELLCMAQDALEAADAPARSTPAPAPAAPRPARPPVARQHHRLRLRYGVTALVLLLIAGVGLLTMWPQDTDRFRGAEDASTWKLEVTTPALQFNWSEVPEAYYYRLVVMDVTEAEVVDVHETRDTRLGRDDAFLLALQSKLDADHPYELYVRAIDVQNREIHSFEPVEFTLTP